MAKAKSFAVAALAAFLFFIFGFKLLTAAPTADIVTEDTAVNQAVSGEGLKNPYFVTGESIILLINKMIDFTPPGSSAIFERRTGQLFIKQTPTNHALVEKILADLRQAAFRQVEIEARFVTVSSQNFKGSGVDLAGINSALSEAGITIGTALLGGPASIPVALQPTLGSFSDSTFVDFPNVTGFGSTSLGQQLSLFARSSKIDFNLLYDSLEHLGQINTLAAPKITVFNNQRAHIRIETIQNYVAEVDSTLTGSTVGVSTAVIETTATIAQARSGSILDVTPTINQDGTITLELHPQYVTVDLDGTQSITNVTGGDDFDNSVTLPIYKSQEINTTMTIPNRGFAIMGGLVQDEETVENNKIPKISSLPVFGKMFSNQQTTRYKTYLLIFIQAKQKVFNAKQSISV